ncbi:hypothetical protein D8S78_07650 [Natrialba swarupiae]|nr:hypothetical protein [Natrialba swarupiae]
MTRSSTNLFASNPGDNHVPAAGGHRTRRPVAAVTRSPAGSPFVRCKRRATGMGVITRCAPVEPRRSVVIKPRQTIE